ncbi:MAG TPA: LysR substrate-binding domain-containing protein [Polyangia bacterium]|nr:LysR substrate-binding domain-containing protein [Polyangia bacterium]
MRLAPHPFTIRQLQYAVAVADERSFRRAAALCGVSQPSLSAQLAQLEGALGVRLFERDPRQVLVTQAGQDLIARARRLLVETDDLTDSAKRLGDPLAATLRLGVIPTISPYLLPDLVPALRRAQPRLVVRWTEEKTSTLLGAVRDGTLEGALLALEVDLGDLEREELARDPFVLAVPRSHALAKPVRPAELSELHGASVLLLDDGHCLRDQALAVCSLAGTQELDFRATSLSTLAQMVAAGVGITLLPRLAVPAESRHAALAIRPLADDRAYRTLGLVWRRTSPLGPALKQIGAVIRDVAGRLPGARAPAAARSRARSPRKRAPGR